MQASPHVPQWRTSSYSGGQNNCVQLAAFPAGVGVRDSKNPGAGALHIPAATWAGLTARVKAGEFDL